MRILFRHCKKLWLSLDLRSKHIIKDVARESRGEGFTIKDGWAIFGMYLVFIFFALNELQILILSTILGNSQHNWVTILYPLSIKASYVQFNGVSLENDQKLMLHQCIFKIVHANANAPKAKYIFMAYHTSNYHSYYPSIRR